MSEKLNPNDGTNMSFTLGFHFSRGVPQCEGPIMETLPSVAIGAKYRIGVQKEDSPHPWSTLPGLDKPKSFSEINQIFNEFGPLCGDVFIFEVFDSNGLEGECLFKAEFNAKEKCPPDGYASDKLVATSFSYMFKLPERLHATVKKAYAEHFAK